MNVNINVPEDDTRVQSRVMTSSYLQQIFLRNYLPQKLRPSSKCWHFPEVGYGNGHAQFGYVHAHVHEICLLISTKSPNLNTSANDRLRGTAASRASLRISPLIARTKIELGAAFLLDLQW